MNGAEIKVWALVGVLFVLIPCLGFFLVREFNRKDKLAEAVDQLHGAVTALTLAVEEIKRWSTERFVLRTQHDRDIESLKDDIAKHAERFERELERCESRCPERCTP